MENLQRFRAHSLCPSRALANLHPSCAKTWKEKVNSIIVIPLDAAYEEDTIANFIDDLETFLPRAFPGHMNNMRVHPQPPTVCPAMGAPHQRYYSNLCSNPHPHPSLDLRGLWFHCTQPAP